MSKKAERTADMLTQCNGSRCKGQGKARALHTCPFKREIHNDDTTLCNCCQLCTFECAMDV